jgi:AraC-like DNA-binding protein
VVLSGAAVLQEGGRDVVFEAGSALLTRADFAYRSAHPFGCGDTGFHVRPSPLLLQELDLPRARCTMVPVSTHAHLRFCLAADAIARGRSDGLALEEASLALLAGARHRDVPVPPRAAHRRHAAIVEDAKALVLRRLGERLCLDEIARGVGASPFHLARVFRRHTGFSLHGYRMRMRLLRSLDRIEEAGGALTDLALDLGFSSHSHFNDAFRNAFGIPPGAIGRSARRGRAASGGTR